MRYVLTLTIGLLAVLGATAGTAAAHDYHRSHRAVEAKHWNAPQTAKRHVQRRAHKRALRRTQQWTRYRYRPRHNAYRRPSWYGDWSRYVIVFSSDGFFRVARRTR